MIRNLSARLLLVVGFSWLALAAGSAQAAGISSYYLAISENNNVVHLTYPASTGDAAAVSALQMAEKYAAWKTQPELIAFRDYPFFEITNTSTDVTAGISHFRIAIDPTRPYNFDTVFYVESSPGITYAINGLDAIQNGLRSDFIDLTFTGFSPGKFFRFRSDIDNDMGNVNFYTDYRKVLTDAGGFNASTNALVTVDMSTGISFNDRIPGGQLMGPYYDVTAIMLEHQMDMVQPYVIGNGATNPIPEPTSLVALGTLIGIGGFYFRRRQQSKAA